MLRNIPSILSPDLLHALRAMGHGDDIRVEHTHQATLEYFVALAPISMRIAFKSIVWRLWPTVSGGPLDDCAPDIQGKKP